MTSPPVDAATSEVWRDLLSLSGEESYERALLDRLLTLWRQRWEVAGAALYLRREGHFRLQETSREPGTIRFPDGFETPPATKFSVLELPAGALLYLGAPEVGRAAAGDPLTLLLASELRNAKLEKALKDQSFQVNYRGVELEALYDVGLAIASTLDLEQLSEEILMRAVSLLDARRGALYRREGERYVCNRTFGGDARAEFEPTSDEEAERVGRRRMRVPDDLLPGAQHLLALPIEIEGDPRGMLAVGDKESRRGIGPFTEQDRRTLSLFANQAAIALENARLHRQALEKQRLEREMELAAEIQREILPHGSPAVDGFELEGWSRPARQVGGDYYDLLALPDGRLRLAVGDVSGKGVPAALLVSTLHSSLRLLIGTARLEAAQLERLNRHVHESSASNKFITTLVVEAENAAGRLRWVNAGHNPGLLMRAGGEVEHLESSGFPVGMLPNATYRVGEAILGPGDLLCLYSDGITEAASPEGEEFGVDRLVSLLVEHRDRPLTEVRRNTDRALAAFGRGEPQGDDETLVLLRRAG